MTVSPNSYTAQLITVINPAIKNMKQASEPLFKNTKKKTHHHLPEHSNIRNTVPITHKGSSGEEISAITQISASSVAVSQESCLTTTSTNTSITVAMPHQHQVQQFLKQHQVILVYLQAMIQQILNHTVTVMWTSNN